VTHPIAQQLHRWSRDDVNCTGAFEMPGGLLLRVTCPEWTYTSDGLLSANVGASDLLFLDPARLVFAHAAPDDGESVSPNIYEEGTR
jgi:hypothetical protein